MPDMIKRTIDLTKRPQGGVAADLSNAPVSLAKQAQKASLALSQISLDDIDAEVILIGDGSRSMHKIYADGRMQKLTDRVAAWGLAVDADGKVPYIPFDGEVRRIIELTAATAEGVIEREVFGPGVKSGILGKRSKTIWPGYQDMGSTNLTDALAEARKMIEKSGRFTIVVVIGDGGPNNQTSATNETIELGKLGAWVKFVALEEVEWLDTIDNLEQTRPGAREYDNVSSVYIPDPWGMSDLAFYQEMVKELPEHIQRATAAGYLA